MFAIRVERFGGPEVLEVQQVSDPKPGPGQALVRLEASGINFIDTYQRTGRYPVPLPFTPGQEGAGVVEAVGENVRDVRVGDRVAYSSVLGAYAERAVVPAERLIAVPKGVATEVAAAVMLQGMTAHFLSHSTFPLSPNDWALIHAGAGGVGLLLTQMAKRRGARVITTVSTEEKARLSREAGADHVILYTQQDFEGEARRLTDGAGVSVVYDSVGKTTFEKSLGCLRPRGMLVLFGGSSGAVPPFDPMVLSQKGSLFLTRPTLNHYIADRQSLLERATDVLGWVAKGELKVRIHARYPLRDVRRAHEDLEARKSEGKLLLIPGA